VYSESLLLFHADLLSCDPQTSKAARHAYGEGKGKAIPLQALAGP
jgi:hypothetical protein